jgi:hypothetical protein
LQDPIQFFQASLLLVVDLVDLLVSTVVRVVLVVALESFSMAEAVLELRARVITVELQAALLTTLVAAVALVKLEKLLT